MTIPTGMATGYRIYFPTISEYKSSRAPMMPVSGKNVRCSFPISIRAICGAMSPTKPMTPVKLMIVAVKSTATLPVSKRTRAGSIPRLMTVSSSLTAMASSGRAKI